MTNFAGNPDDFTISQAHRGDLLNGYVALMKTLRQKLDAASAADGKYYLLSAAVSASGWILRGAETYQVTQYLDYASLRGDTSDNLPGVPGIGEKTVQKLLRAFGSLERVRTAPESELQKVVGPVATARLRRHLQQTASPFVQISGSATASELEADQEPHAERVG